MAQIENPMSRDLAGFSWQNPFACGFHLQILAPGWCLHAAKPTRGYRYLSPPETVVLVTML
jgi:hypothetical protein